MYKVDGVGCLEEVADQLLMLLKDQKLWLFEGPMGSGKTSLIRAICRKLGVEEVVSSPTFTLLHSYLASEDRIVHHADLYRLRTIDELREMGMDDYLYGPDYCFVEWADRCLDYWPEPQSWVSIEHRSDGARCIAVRASASCSSRTMHFDT